MKSVYLLLILCLCFVINSSKAQETTPTTTQKKMHGTYYITWGYHRDAYTDSDIRFHDNSNPPAGNYDFTITDMKANDQPDFSDLFTRPISVPQYVFNIGYFFNNKSDLGVEFSWDHLKYVMVNTQTAYIKGIYDRKTVDGMVKITPNFLRFEHTNGNNYGMINLVKRFKLFDKERKYHKVSLITKIGTGLLIPKTDSYILGQHQDGPFRISGFCLGTSTGIRYDFFKYLFIELAAKGVFVNYTDIKLYGDGRAEQTFWSSQLIWSAGINIPLSK